MGPEKIIDPERHVQGPIIPVPMVGVPILHILHDLFFRQRSLPVPGNDVIQSQTVHHAFAMITDPAMSGMGDPLVNVEDRLILHKVQGIYQTKINTNRLGPKTARPN